MSATRANVRWALWTFAITAGTTAAVQTFSVFFGKRLDAWYVGGVVLLALVLRKVVRTVRSTHEDRTPSVPIVRESGALVAKRPFAEVNRWENRLSWSAGDPERYDRAVTTRLRDLTDERLRQRHSVTMTTDPGRAHAIIGDHLWSFLHHPLAVTPTPAQLDWYIARIEEI
ncbi:hypothetical protein [Phytomonospora endophytica]|uniref:Uncharacterized protein n=1 Tax=Phytomonospora endophytica TaxID=714109 RepID=A0A841FNR5_9ACTN|nr:hypothetical protein [Phytomonospora endophytica]MBB6036513.1 hypothetical protein [Phytomonospora endophytica]GIG65835.1 hypothetical protein Pen01_21300 [Phytomonospora endophytica]